MFAGLSWARGDANEDKSYKDALNAFENQNYEEVIDVLTESIKNYPNEDSYYILTARAFERLNNKTKAREYYDMAIELDTNDIWAYVGRSVVSEDFSEQEYWAKEVIAKFPYRSTAAVALLHSHYVSQAIQEENAGNVENALELLEKTKKLNNEYLMRLENAPEDIFKEEFFEILPKELNKQSFRKSLEEKLKGLSDMEKEWNAKYNK